MLLTGGHTQIPSFANDDDDPNMLTQHFDLNISSQLDTSQYPLARRVYYHSITHDNALFAYQEKLRLANIMIQFIYMTRRQMSFMSVLRKKYKAHYKYMIGYLFGLLRMVRQQQMILYRNLQTHLYNYDNPMIQLQFYFRVSFLLLFCTIFTL